ncbi:uncharacterized protein K02A2.6-like [Armigeres subalbatus]|uniref:uncharacterized protein K02A2.6-like n=1 Tax=Armigeres subalbatus TaxID=124917 RepID=UPI002ED5E6FA
MTTEGKYVLAPLGNDGAYESDNRSDASDARSDAGSVDIDDLEVAAHETVEADVTAPCATGDMNGRLLRLEKMLEKFMGHHSSETLATTDKADESETSELEPSSGSGFTDRGTNIRWDLIPKFPKDVPSNKLWENWQSFIENFEIATSLSTFTGSADRAKLLYLSVGKNLQDIMSAADLQPNYRDPRCYSKLVTGINNYFRSMTDTAAEHKAFQAMHQAAGESIVTFHARLIQKARLCGYSPADQVRFATAQLLKGMRNREMAMAARTYGYDASYIVQAGTRVEAYEAGQQSMERSNVHAINRKRERSREKIFSKTRRTEEARDTGGKKTDREGDNTRCWRCGFTFHKKKTCPALDKKCNTCGRIGHFAGTCRRQSKNTGINSIMDSHAIISWMIFHADGRKILMMNSCRLSSFTPLNFLVDSGADVNIVGGADWNRLEKEFRSGHAKLELIDHSVAKEIRAYATDAPIVIRCAFRAEVEVLGAPKPVVTAKFLVVEEGRRSLLGRRTASELKLLKVGLSVNNCEVPTSALFPKMPGVRVKFSIDRSVPPEKNAYYNVPAAYREAARARLEDMEAQGIIERVLKAPEWISGMSAVPKGKNDFRLVVNMRAPNKAIQREYFRMPLIDELKVKLDGARYFSKLDLSNAYYHLELCKESRDLTTFLTENGMYRFTRLMFGVNCAPEIFQREMCRLLEGIDNIVIYIDDVLIFADKLEKLKATTGEVLKILRANNLTLNEAKCEFEKEFVIFLGHGLDKDGFHVDDAKVKSIRRFRPPSSISELKSFLGLASFISPYIKDFANISSTLWQATTAKSWCWGPEQLAAFEMIKNRITNCTTALGYFSESERTILYTDASPNALGRDEPFDEEHSPWQIATLEANSIRFLTEEEIRKETAKDQILQSVMDALETNAWPENLRRFKNVSNDLSVHNGILIKNGCAVVPSELRQKTLNLAHDGHPMTAKLKSILRERVWWPGIGTDAEEWVKTCKTCATNGRPEKPTPMKRIFAPQTVWETIALDFNGPYARYGGISILLMVDYRSRFLIARPVKSTSFDQTKQVFEEIFAREGFPKHIRSDNGPPFNGDEYKKYCADRGIETIFSTPLFPQQNGLVENYMKLVNKAMASAVSNGLCFKEELQAAVNAHNAAAHSVTGVPPEEVMLGRKIKRRLPLLRYEKAKYDDELLNRKDKIEKLKSKEREDSKRGARASCIKPGDTVIIERMSRSKGESRFDPEKYTVLKQDNGNLFLQNDRGQTVKRHVTQTRKVGNWREPFEERIDSSTLISKDISQKKLERPSRTKNPPGYLKNYVQLIKN